MKAILWAVLRYVLLETESVLSPGSLVDIVLNLHRR